MADGMGLHSIRHLHFPLKGLFWVHSFIVCPLPCSPFRQLLQGLTENYRSLVAVGRSHLYTFFSVILPLSRQGIITGCVLSFCSHPGRIWVVLMIGGNIPGITKVASVAIYDEVQSPNYGSANIYSAILLSFSFDNTYSHSLLYYNRRFIRTI